MCRKYIYPVSVNRACLIADVDNYLFILNIIGGLGTSGFRQGDIYDEGDQCLEVYTYDFAYNYINLDYIQSLNKLEQEQKDFVLNRLKISK